MKKYLILFFAFFMPFISIQAQLDPELEDKFSEALSTIKENTGVVGLSATVITSEGVWVKAEGDNTATLPLDTDAALGIGSVSKTIVSAVILQMYEDGLLELEDSIGIYLDEYPNIDPGITIRQLLNHTSGVFNVNAHPDFWYTLNNNLDTILSAEETVTLYVAESNFEPGAEYSYSNTNYILLGMIIEAISGKPYYEEARERFSFDVAYPSLAVVPFESPIEDLANYWTDISSTGAPVVDVHALGQIPNSVFSAFGASGAYSGVPYDVAQWAYDLYSGSLLNESTMDELFTVTPPSTNYGLGVRIYSMCSQEVVGHGGFLYYYSRTLYDPENDISVSVHCNENFNAAASLANNLICIYNYHLTTTSGSEDILVSNTIKVTPNPASDYIWVEFEATKPASAHLTLLNNLGQIVYQEERNNLSVGFQQIELNFSSIQIPSGLYYLRVQFGNESHVEPVVFR